MVGLPSLVAIAGLVVGLEDEARTLLAAGDRHFDADRSAASILSYRRALALANCSGALCETLTNAEHVQAHANMGASYMSIAHSPSWTPDAIAFESYATAASLKHWSIPHEMYPSGTSAFFLELLQRDLALLRATRRYHADGGARPAALRVEAVARVAASELTVDEFSRLYAVPRRPVVIEGADLPDLDAFLRSLEPFGESRVPLRRHETGSRTWAALSQKIGETTLGAVLEKRRSGTNGSELLVFDWPLPEAVRFPVPPYFAGDVLAGLPRDGGFALAGQWPSLFVQPAGTRCGLHTDAHATHFWQALIGGRKTWRIFDRDATARLYPHGPNRNWYGVSDAFAAPDAAFPALRGATVFEADLRPGDLIFVPAGLPHQVVNVEATVAISVNFVDETNLDDAIDALFLACEGCESGVRPDFEMTRRRLIALRDELRNKQR